MLNKTNDKNLSLQSSAFVLVLLWCVLLCLAFQEFGTYSDSIILEQIELQAQSDCDSDNNKQDTELKLDSDKYFSNSKTINFVSFIHHSTNLTMEKTYSSVIIEHIDPPPELLC